MTSPILQVKDLSVYYNKKKALNSVSIDFYPNEITALIGPSGSGKSTLLRSVNRMGDLNPEVTLTGAIDYNGKNIYSPRTDTVDLRKEIGMVFQLPNPFPMSIYENVVYGLRINGIKDKHVLDEAVEKSLIGASIWDEVKDRLHDSALGLSGGQQQRVAIARALATKPAIILADEPTGNLDSKTSMDVILLMQSISRQFHQTTIMITHNEEIAQMADRTIRIEDGKVVSGGVRYAR